LHEAFRTPPLSQFYARHGGWRQIATLIRRGKVVLSTRAIRANQAIATLFEHGRKSSVSHAMRVFGSVLRVRRSLG
jgi:hypothetical protein